MQDITRGGVNIFTQLLFIVCLFVFRSDTKLAVLDHVTSVHALVLPIKVSEGLLSN